MNMGRRGREGRGKFSGRPKKMWMNCAKCDMYGKEITAVRIEWEKEIGCAGPVYCG